MHACKMSLIDVQVVEVVAEDRRNEDRMGSTVPGKFSHGQLELKRSFLELKLSFLSILLMATIALSYQFCSSDET